MNDLTAPLEIPEFDKSIKGKKILIIGSGADNDGRRMKKRIDSKYYDFVIRLNKHYGNEQDTGTRTDVIFTRWLQWIEAGQNFFTEEDIKQAQKVIIVNQHVGISQTEIEQAKLELGHNYASAGILAVLWCINREAKQIDLIGYGMQQGKFMNSKRYCKNSKNYPDGMTDNNTLYNWQLERKYLLNQPQVKFL